jgi:protein-S-isoprenylcysteine O-methyltransferase Ste14
VAGVVAGAVTYAAGSLLILLAFRANTHASSVIEVEAKQSLVTTGLYGVVRHPMYSAALLMTIATPIVLGSYWALLTVVPATALVVARLLSEERLLAGELPGYVAYMKSTRRRLIPGVW